MKRFKRIVAVLLTCTMLFTLGGCGNLRKNISKWLDTAKDYYEDFTQAKISSQSRTSLLNSDYKSEMEVIKETETTLIEALNNKDRELLKSVFSEDAILKDPAIEEGIDYLFGLYERDFIEVMERNHSSSDYWGVPGRTKEISAWCLIKTSKAMYDLHYVLWAIQEQEPAKKGVYCVQLFEHTKKVPSYIDGD